MSSVIFSFDGNETTIQCTKDTKMKDIINKFITKSKIDINNAQFLYGGSQINFEQTFYEQAW